MLKNNDDKVHINSFFLALTIVNVLTILIIVYIGYVIQAEGTCGRTDIKNTTLNGIDNSSYYLSSPNDYYLQPFIINKPSKYERYTFCYEVYINGTDGVNIVIINQNQESLQKSYLEPGYNKECLNIEENPYKPYFKNENYLGIKCLNCDSTNKLIPQEELLGINIKQVYYQNGNIIVTSGHTNKLTLFAYSKCQMALKFTIIAWILINILTGIIILIIYGFEKLTDILTPE